ncbi:MAG: diaminopimelate epimerase [Candidatus Omnitrophota bacterium]
MMKKINPSTYPESKIKRVPLRINGEQGRIINFTKMTASGNDFVVIEKRNLAARNKSFNNLARQACDRKFGIGADGLLLLEKTKKAVVRMRIFNADGSEAEMCGNGARCAALYLGSQLSAFSSQLKIETKAGIIEAYILGNNVKIKLTDPTSIKLNIPLEINNRLLKVNFINTGVPHTVIFVNGLGKINVVSLGRQIRYHKNFSPKGTNVNFVEILNNNSILTRTYERGVEDETLACGTGSAASALLTVYSLGLTTKKSVNVHTRSGEVLKVYFDRINNHFRNVWLEGKARIVYKGEYHV